MLRLNTHAHIFLLQTIKKTMHFARQILIFYLFVLRNLGDAKLLF